MLTFQDQYQLYQQISQDFTAAGLLIAKRDINEGGAMFLNRLGRKFNKEYLQTNLVAGQQYYQMSTTTLRISEAQLKDAGGNFYTPQLVTSEEEWNAINSIATRSNVITHYYIRGFNEIGVYPLPASAITNGLKVSFEPQHVDLTQDDYTTGSITVSNGNTSITHSASGFTPQMVGRWLQVTDGTDGKWYKIGAYTSASILVLENYYEGIGGAGRSFRIGEMMKIPNAYQDAPVYYALDRFYQTQNDQKTAQSFEIRFSQKVKSAKETYGRSTSRMGVKTGRGGRRPTWLDLTPPVQYP
jgi:hypothetical protein